MLKVIDCKQYFGMPRKVSGVWFSNIKFTVKRLHILFTFEGLTFTSVLNAYNKQLNKQTVLGNSIEVDFI